MLHNGGLENGNQGLKKGGPSKRHVPVPPIHVSAPPPPWGIKTNLTKNYLCPLIFFFLYIDILNGFCIFIHCIFFINLFSDNK